MADPTATSTKITRVGAVRAVQAGAQAKRDGKAVGSCPHPVDGSLTDRFYGHFWRKGYALTR